MVAISHMVGNELMVKCVRELKAICIRARNSYHVGGVFMKYGMVSVLIPSEYESTFRKNARNTMQDAANVLQWNLYQGLCENLGCSIPLFNILPCGSYPQYYQSPFVSRFMFAEKGLNLSFCNVKFVRNYCKTVALKKELKRWCQSSSESKTLFVYTISQPLMAAVAAVKREYPQLQICAIVADLPNMSNLSSRKSRLLEIFSARRAQDSYSMLTFVDSFVLLTKHMAEYMHITQPFCVMEGIATSKSEFPETKYESEIKTVFYAGTLHRRFGVLNLVEAFQLIKDPKYRLVLCGTGDCEDEIVKAAMKDSRIEFYGQLPRAEILKLQVESTVLVNPRQNIEAFTKYSFPSKNLEYLSSGIPFIAYKLDGTPDEYDDYILYVEKNDVESLAKKIIEVCKKTSQERKLIGTKAREFVTEKKNKVVQTRKIISFLNQEGELDKNDNNPPKT